MSKIRRGIICGVVIMAVGAGAAGVYIHSTQDKAEASEVVETTFVEKKNLKKSVSITGVVQGKGSYNLASDVTDAKIKRMNVKTGDVVKKGQVLAVIDASSVEDEIEKLKKEEQAQNQKNEIAAAAGERNVESAKQSLGINVNRAQNELKKTEKEVKQYQEKQDKAESKTKEYQNKYKKSKKQLASLEKKEKELVESGRDTERQINTLQRQLETAQTQASAKESAYNTAQDNYKENSERFEENPALKRDLQAKIDAAQKEWNDAKETVTAINQSLAALQDASNENKYRQEDIQKSVSRMENKSSDYKSKYENSKSEIKPYAESEKTSISEKIKNKQGLEDARREGNKTIQENNDSYRTSSIDAGVSGLDSDLQIKKLERQKEGAVLKAPCDGIVTEVAATEGSIYKGDTLITVQDNSSYKITAAVDQYHIGELEDGMKAEIHSQVDKDNTMTGKLTYIAQFAGGNSDSSSGSSSGQSSGNTNTADTQDNYSIEVTPDKMDPSLKLGMKVKVTIIEKESKDAFAVPSDCIQEGGDGSAYMELNDENGTKVKVKTGMATDYYTEIKGKEIKKGMEVVLPSVTDSEDTEEGGIMDVLY